MKEHIPGALVGAVFTLLITGIGYVWVIKDHTRELEYLSEALKELKIEQDQQMESVKGGLKDSQNRIGKLNLFMVSVHPEKYTPNISSVEKFKEFSGEDLTSLADDVTETLPAYEQVKASVDASDEERLDLILDKIKKGQQLGGGTMSVADDLGVEPTELQSLHATRILHQYLSEGRLNGDDLNFAYELMSAEESPRDYDELERKREEVIKEFLMDSLKRGHQEPEVN